MDPFQRSLVAGLRLLTFCTSAAGLGVALVIGTRKKWDWENHDNKDYDYNNPSTPFFSIIFFIQSILYCAGEFIRLIIPEKKGWITHPACLMPIDLITATGVFVPALVEYLIHGFFEFVSALFATGTAAACLHLILIGFGCYESRARYKIHRELEREMAQPGASVVAPSRLA